MAARTILARSVALALAVCSGGAWADQFDWSAYLSGEHSDNAALTTTNPISTNVIAPGVNFSYARQGSVFQANVAGNLEYRDYSSSVLGNQTVAEINGQANWSAIPQRLDVTMQDAAGVAPVNSLASNAPGNQQQTNVLAVGPTLHFLLGAGMSGDAELKYINSYASRVDQFNSSRGAGALRVFRDLSPTDQLSANMELERVAFSSSTAGSNYTSYALYGRYTSRLAKLDIDASLGWSNIDFTQGASQSGPLARLTLGWRLSPRSTITVDGVYQYSDAAQDMLQPTNISIGGELVPLQPVTLAADTVRGGIGVGNVVISSDVYKERQLSAAYSFQGQRFSFSVSPAYSKLDYVNDVTFNQASRGVGATASYRLTPDKSVSVFGTADRTTYDTISRRDRTYRYGLAFNHQFTSHWSWSASFARQTQSSNTAGQSYHENEIFLTVTYKR
ncbi:outer membrane beta-barrel protein [Dyella sedimenti]|uniref:outer membrane beta-barrel protein n=1 Tax=Dyella sedimenti TaxID=2919947 RepID=UPI001FAAB71B|nr:outer membrane beta-barrel protein [Dyella sedimenti]